MIKLVRLDYRLLHGQVVFSWTGHVGAQRIIVVDDDAANDEMKKSALLLSKPAGVRVNIFTVDKAIAKMPKVEQLDEKIMMIFGNTAALLDAHRHLGAGLSVAVDLVVGKHPCCPGGQHQQQYHCQQNLHGTAFFL
jgi:mannose/fructose/N-acetylgalactosamine-specific phosphotransferase system component IIB